MVENKPFCYLEGNGLKNLTDENKGQVYNPKRYSYKKTRTKTQVPELKAETNFKGRCSDLEGYIFDLGPKSSDKFSRTTKETEQCLGETCSNICQLDIMN